MSIKSLFSTKKRIAAVALSGAIILGTGGIAAAYFTSTGSGTGSATVGSATTWTVGETAGSSTGGPLFPDHAIGGANIQTDGYTVTNAGSGSQSLTNVTIKVATLTGAAWSSRTNTSLPACTAADFSVGASAVGSTYTDTALAGDYTAGETNATGSVTVELIDNSLNQDNCQGVTVPLYFVAS